MDPRLQNIKLFLMDMDGTVYLGSQRIAGAFEALERLRQSGRRIAFLTNNSSRTQQQYIERVAKFDFCIDRNEIYTSVMATCHWLQTNHAGKRVFVLAPPAVQAEMASLGIHVVGATHADGTQEPVGDRPDIVVLGFDTTLAYDRLYLACQYINQGALYVATHPDDFCPSDICPMPDVGGMIAMIKHTLYRDPDIIIGKPYAPMAQAVADQFGLRPDQIAMVGDRLYTDIRFATDNGLTGILVLTGETTPQMLEQSSIRPTLVLSTFADILPLLDMAPADN